MVIIKFFATLRNITKTNEMVIEQEGSIEDMLEIILKRYEDLRNVVYKNGNIYIKILLNGRNIDFLNGLATHVDKKDTLYLFPPIAGG